MTGAEKTIPARVCSGNEWYRAKKPVLYNTGVKSEGPPAFVVGLFECRTLVEIRLAPDPRLVCAAHVGFHGMDRAEVARLSYPAQERANGNIFPGVGVDHPDSYHIAKRFSPEAGTVYGYTVLHDRDKPAQDIGPLLLHPCVHIRYGWGNARAEDPATESALVTGFVFGYRNIHTVPIHYSSGIWIIVPGKSKYRVSDDSAKLRDKILNSYALYSKTSFILWRWIQKSSHSI